MMSTLIYPDWPIEDKVLAFTTTRIGGVSQIPYNNFNLAMHVNDNLSDVVTNRQKLQEYIPSVEIKWLKQIHSNKVVNASAIDSDLVEADAAFTVDRNIACAVLTADCLPILLTDKQGECVAAIHAGWRGLLNGVVSNAVSTMSKYKKPSYAWLGPAIGPHVFEVGEDVYEAYMQSNPAFKDSFMAKKVNQKTLPKWNLNIYQAAKVVLNAADIFNVFGGEYCTYTDSDQFFSYRRQAITGRMATIISKR